MIRTYWLTLRMVVLCLLLTLPNGNTFCQPSPDCNIPLTGKQAIVDFYGGNVASVLNVTDFSNLVDADLNNYVELDFTSVVGVLTTPLVSVKKINGSISAGRNAGFVVEITNGLGGLIGADVLNSLELNTYLNNQLQESATYGGGIGISVSLLSGASNKVRLNLETSLPFDEIELAYNGLVNTSLLSEFRLYYAFHEGDNCDYDCRTPAIPAYFPAVGITTGCSGVLCGTLGNATGISNIIDNDTSNVGSLSVPLLQSRWVDVSLGADVLPGNEAGFAFSQVGILGDLLELDIAAINISTYHNGALIDNYDADDPLVGIGLLNGDSLEVSFIATDTFDQLRFTISSILDLNTYNIYYAFVRYDDDGDGFANCVDKCPNGSDAFDYDGDGFPDDCDPVCLLNAGIDVQVCTDENSHQLKAAQPYQSWSADPANPGSVSVNQSGLITGMSQEGTYRFILSDSICSDTINIYYYETLGTITCNNPFTGNNKIVEDAAGCVLCNDVAANNVIDGDLSNYVEDGSLLTLILGASNTPLITVKDTGKIYPGGSRAGYVVSFPVGLLNLSLLQTFEIRTYLNDAFVESSGIGGSSILNADILGNNDQQRISFETTLPFDEIEIRVVGGLVSLELLNSIRIYYPFTEDAACDGGNSVDSLDIPGCFVPLVANDVVCASVEYSRSGISGVACALCSMDSVSNIVDEDLSNPITINLTASIIGEASISVSIPDTIPAGSKTGFITRIGDGLLAADLLDAFDITTYLNGSLQETYTTNNALISVQLLGGGSDKSIIGFTTTLPFNEVQFTADANLLTLGVGSGLIEVYYGFYELDEDQDGTPDCRDKCCGSDDSLDADGDGMPDNCDEEIDAIDDTATTLENLLINIPVLDNDIPGSMGIDTASTGFVIIDSPSHGTTLILDNGTADRSDDSIQYIPDALFTGQDTFSYAICDNNLDCDTATVIVTVEVDNNGPDANPDYATVNEFTPTNFSLLNNDTDPDNNLDTSTMQIVVGPENGNASILPGGMANYTPNFLFTGVDSFWYCVCDQSVPEPLCDTSYAVITVLQTLTRVRPNVFLQGPLLNSADTLMSDSLAKNGLIPLTEPYTALSNFEHVGGGGGKSIVDSLEIFSRSGIDAIVDWVFVELRDSADYSVIVDTRSALLLSDGRVRDVNGISPVVFIDAPPNRNYYVSIRHRNHLGAMPLELYPLNTVGVDMNLADTTVDLYHISPLYDGLEQAIVNGKYALWYGDVNHDRKIVFQGQDSDQSEISSQVINAPGNILHSPNYVLNGYNTSDLRLRGFAVLNGQGNDVSLLFNQVTQHAANFFNSLSFVIPENLPN